jgi:hypothetical protein
MLRYPLSPLATSARRCSFIQRKPSLERLEDRTLPDAAAVFASLSDANLQGLAQADYERDGALTRNDMIGIFNEVVQEGRQLTATQLGDLNTLVNNGSTLGMPASVENLAGKVVGYDLANRSFHGKTLLSSGQLAAGKSSTDLTDLVDKWFLGQDTPRAMNYWHETFRYATAHGTLFAAAGPSNLDVSQGAAGDCYFLAALGETVSRDPQAVQNMFIDNGDGTFTVRFFHETGGTAVADYITVNNQLPVDRWGRFVFADMGQKAASPNNVLWVALAEKAYAQLAAEGWSRAGLAGPVNSYYNITGGFGDQAMQQITGDSTSWQLTHGTNAVAAMINELASGDLVTLATNHSEPRGSHVLADHEYYVTAYDAVKNTFTIVNPWGANLPKVGTLHLTASQVGRYFSEVDVAVASGA